MGVLGRGVDLQLSCNPEGVTQRKDARAEAAVLDPVNKQLRKSSSTCGHPVRERVPPPGSHGCWLGFLLFAA